MKTKFLFFFLLVIAFPVFSQKWSPPELRRIPFTSHHDKEEKNFYLYLPEGFDGNPDKKWPVILFLHGNGERGNSREDLDWLLK
ncbi:MAG TPA: hypothetical protein VFV79_08920, partial [Saprospiraceae bacterium]|nr:hypothetical protein [Saprospiraceae bacterium]